MERMIVILGPTATGKTRLAALLASKINGEIISADSRQVYRNMDIGTGKDLGDYMVEGRLIKSHLVDIAEAGERYSLFQYRKDFEKAYNEILSRKSVPVVCGGSGMYIDSALGLYDLEEVNENSEFRQRADNVSTSELVEQLKQVKDVHNTSDYTDRDRLIRALEIATASQKQVDTKIGYDNPPATNLIFGIDLPREVIRQRITERLTRRLEEGLLDEVRELLDKGLQSSDLIYYGLEYKYITLYLTGELSYDEMFRQLNTAIHQFAKRQMTWFRRMEKRGIKINWLLGTIEDMVSSIVIQYNKI